MRAARQLKGSSDLATQRMSRVLHRYASNCEHMVVMDDLSRGASLGSRSASNCRCSAVKPMVLTFYDAGSRYRVNSSPSLTGTFRGSRRIAPYRAVSRHIALYRCIAPISPWVTPAHGQQCCRFVSGLPFQRCFGPDILITVGD